MVGEGHPDSQMLPKVRVLDHTTLRVGARDTQVWAGQQNTQQNTRRMPPSRRLSRRSRRGVGDRSGALTGPLRATPARSSTPVRMTAHSCPSGCTRTPRTRWCADRCGACLARACSPWAGGVTGSLLAQGTAALRERNRALPCQLAPPHRTVGPRVVHAPSKGSASRQPQAEATGECHSRT